MQRPIAARLVSALLVVATVGGAGAAHAQNAAAPKPPPAVQALFDEAAEALDRKDFAVACPKLEEVVRRVPDGVGARLALAECYEGDGRLASAWSAYMAVERVGGPQQASRKRAARARAEGLRPRLATLTVSVPPSARALPDLEIESDGALLALEQWDAPVPVDKGTHVVRATASGRVPFQKSVSVAADGVRVVIQVGDLLPVAVGLPDGGAAEPAPTAPAPGNGADPPRSFQRLGGIAVGWFGLTVVGVGAGFGFAAIAKKGESESGPCQKDGRCTAEGLELRADGRTFGDVSTALILAGGAAVATGVVLFLTAPSPPAAPSPTAPAVAGAGLLIAPGHVALRLAW